MPARIRAAWQAAGQAGPSDRPALVRSILDSLALAYARAIDDAERLAERQVDELLLVGGGSRNSLLCQLVANATRRPVSAGPVEATAMGNALVQARSLGAVEGDLARLRTGLRETLARGPSLRRYEPNSPSPHASTAAFERTS
jgi:rhamnulokinase